MAAISWSGDAAICFLPVDHPIRLCRISGRGLRIKLGKWIDGPLLAVAPLRRAPRFLSPPVKGGLRGRGFSDKAREGHRPRYSNLAADACYWLPLPGERAGVRGRAPPVNLVD